MNEFFTDHGHQEGSIKSARPENKIASQDVQTKQRTKVEMAPNHHEGVRNEPSHSGNR